MGSNAVSYTHLDVYKRQIPLLFLWENQSAVFLSGHFPVIDIRALCHPDCQSIL